MKSIEFSSFSDCSKSDDFHIWRPLGVPFIKYIFRGKTNVENSSVFDVFLSSKFVSRKSLLKSRCFVCTGDDFFQNITFYLHERPLFNVVRDDYPCRPPEGTAEAQGQGPAAGLC